MAADSKEAGEIISRPLSFFKKKGAYDISFKFTVKGDSATGKTCLAKRFSQDTYTASYVSNIRDQPLEIKTINLQDKTIKLQIWEAKSGRFSSISTDDSLKNTHAAIVTFDVTDRQSFESVKQHIKELGISSAKDVETFLVATKCDVPEEQREVRKADIEKLEKELEKHVFRTSAKTGEGVEKLFMEVTSRMLAHEQQNKKPGPSTSYRR